MASDRCARVQVKVTHPALLPSKNHPNDAGYDLRAADGGLIEHGQHLTVPTGVFLGLPDGYEAQIRPRSGLAHKNGVTIVNSPGTVDSGYRGELKIILANLGKEPFFFQRGDRIAQMVIHKLPTVGIDLVDTLDDDTERGEKGFGSSGVK